MTNDVDCPRAGIDPAALVDVHARVDVLGQITTLDLDVAAVAFNDHMVDVRLSTRLHRDVAPGCGEVTAADALAAVCGTQLNGARAASLDGNGLWCWPGHHHVDAGAAGGAHGFELDVEPGDADGVVGEGSGHANAVLGQQMDVAGAGFQVVFVHRVHCRAGCRCRAACDGEVDGVQQPGACLALRCAGVHFAAQRQVLFARGFHLTAVAALDTAACGDLALEGGGAIGPGHHGTALAVLGGTGIDLRTPCHRGGLGVGHAGILALPATTQQHLAAAVGSAGIDVGGAAHVQGLGRGLEQAAQAVEPLSACAAVDGGLVFCADHDLAAIGLHSLHVHLTAVAQGAGKHAHGIALQRAQVDSLVGGGLDFKAQAVEAGGQHFHLVARCQQHRSVGGLHQCAGSHLHIGGQH